VTRAAADLPESTVGLVAPRRQAAEDRHEQPPARVVERIALVDVPPRGVEQIAVDAELNLVRGHVPDAHRLRPAIAVERNSRSSTSVPSVSG
jgi:hypothetical protein